MISSLLGYRLNATDYTASLDRIASKPTVAKEAKYYEENIGKVTSVDDLLSDFRLTSYALKAYGLDDYVNSQGFIRKVLESDLTDSDSFANKLSDARFKQFAAAFDFSSAEAATLQSDAQEAALSEAYSEHRVALATSAATKTNAYSAAIAKVATVDQFLADATLVDVSLKAAGIDPTYVSKNYLRQVLTGQIVDDPSTASDNKFIALAAKFTFDAQGNATGGVAQTAAAAERTLYDYDVAVGNTSSSVFAARNSAYVRAQLATGGVDTVDELLADQRILDYIYAATNLTDVSETKAFLKTILTSSRTDPASTLNTLPTSTAAQSLRKERLTMLNSWFNADSSGNLTAQTAAQVTGLEEAYHDNYASVNAARDERMAARFEAVSAKVDTLSEFLRNDAAYGDDHLEYALNAFGIDVDEVSRNELRKILTSDISDPKSYVNKLGDERFLKLAAAFNFGPDGSLVEQRTVQSVTTRTQIGTLYTASFGTDLSDAKKAVIKADTTDYLSRVGKLTNLTDLLADTKVLDYALKAYGLEDEDFTTAEMKKILTSDLSDPDSFAYSFDNAAVVKFAQSFNITPDGLISLDTGGVQSGADLVTTKKLYLSAQLESDVGENTSEGSRLALYFLRKAPDITSVYGILADKALLEVAKTALGLPDGFSSLEIEKQASILEAKIDVADYKDSGKLDDFLNRFAALYDIANDTATSTSPVLQLFSGTSSGTSDILSLLYA